MISKKIRKAILARSSGKLWVSRIESWHKRREKSQAEIDRDILIMTLNGVRVARRRGQATTSIYVLAETETKPLDYSSYFIRAEEAAKKAIDFLNGNHFNAHLGYGFENRVPYPVASMHIFVSHVHKGHMTPIDKRHWKERQERAKNEGGPRERRKKKRKKK